MAHTAIVIPARQGSSRFPNKPLALILEKTLLYRTWRIAKAVGSIDEVFISTDDSEIQKHAESFGAQVILTHGDYKNGTERVLAALKKVQKKPELIVNLQGDAVLTPPWVIQEVVDQTLRDSSIEIATPAIHLNWNQYQDFLKFKRKNSSSGTLVVFDRNKNALYFSKTIIPFLRTKTQDFFPIYRHIGLYAYRYEALNQYSHLNPTPLETAEQLEQLRALENGLKIRVIEVDYRGRTHWSIDYPEDIQIAENLILKEGELI